MEQRQIMDISLKSILKVILVVLVFILAWKIWQILAGIFLALVLAAIVEGAIEFLKRFKFPRVLSVVLVYLIILAALYSAFYLLIPPIINEIGQLTQNLPGYFEKFFKQFDGAKAIFQEYKTSESFQKSLIVLGEKLAKIAASLPAFLTAIFGGLITVFLMLFISFLLSLEEKGVEKFLKFFAPLYHYDGLIEIINSSQKKMRAWFKGRVFSALMVGLLVYLGLWLIGVEYKVTLALLAALFEFVPIIGPWIAGLIGVIISGLQVLKFAFFSAILYLVVQQIEIHLLAPLIMREMVGLNPVITILVLLIGAELGGILGVLIAVPLTVILLEIINNYRKKKGLEPLPR